MARMFDATFKAIGYLLLFQKLSAVNSASLHLKKSEKFKRVLELVLAFGNYMNSCRRGVVYGFRLQSLEIVSSFPFLTPSLEPHPLSIYSPHRS